jgi:hypothetical protein
MRLFIAREAVDPHLTKAGAFVDPNASGGAKAKGALGLGVHLAGWFPGLVVGWGRWPRYGDFGALAGHMQFAERASRKLGRTLFYAMARFGPKLEKKQAVLFRLVDVGAELFAMSAVCVRAKQLLRDNPSERGPEVLADIFCRGARSRIAQLFHDVFRNNDPAVYRVAMEVLAGKHTWLERGYPKSISPTHALSQPAAPALADRKSGQTAA